LLVAVHGAIVDAPATGSEDEWQAQARAPESLKPASEAALLQVLFDSMSTSGTVTLVFTEIEGSTRLLHELGEEVYRAALSMRVDQYTPELVLTWFS
jgi:class 3 adenylate cyclase